MPQPVRQAPQQHGVGEGEPDPVDPEQRQRHPPHARVALVDGQHEQHRQHGDRHQQDLELVAVQRRRQQACQAEEAGQPHRMGAIVHRVQLVHAHAPEREQADREHEAALDVDEQCERDGRKRDDRSRAQVRAFAAHRPPKRRRRSENSASDCSSASRVKSGHSSSRNTSSE